MASGYGGQEGWGKGCFYSRVRLVTSAENNPELAGHTHGQHVFPQAEVIPDVKAYLALPLGCLRYAVIFFSSFYTSYSTDNANWQGASGWSVGGCYADVGRMVEAKLPSIWISDSEDAEGVKWGEPSAGDALREETPSFTAELVDVDSGKMVSPVTGEMTHTRHIRTLAVGCYKGDFVKPLPLKLGMLREVVEFALRFTDSLDGPEEAAEYR